MTSHGPLVWKASRAEQYRMQWKMINQTNVFLVIDVIRHFVHIHCVTLSIDMHP